MKREHSHRWMTQEQRQYPRGPIALVYICNRCGQWRQACLGCRRRLGGRNYSAQAVCPECIRTFAPRGATQRE